MLSYGLFALSVSLNIPLDGALEALSASKPERGGGQWPTQSDNPQNLRDENFDSKFR